MRKNKKAMELSINFMVTLILALVMLGVGFYFAKNIFIHTTDIGEQLDAQTKNQLEMKLRDPASLVAIGVNRKIINRGKHDTFGVGVANRDKQKGYFYLEVWCVFGEAKNKDGEKVHLPPVYAEKTSCSQWIQAKNSGKMSPGSGGAQPSPIYEIKAGELDPNKFELAMLFFNVDKKAETGLYVYNVQAYKKASEKAPAKQKYDSIKKVYLEVS